VHGNGTISFLFGYEHSWILSLVVYFRLLKWVVVLSSVFKTYLLLGKIMNKTKDVLTGIIFSETISLIDEVLDWSSTYTDAMPARPYTHSNDTSDKSHTHSNYTPDNNTCIPTIPMTTTHAFQLQKQQ
jgi:hypothetical protein